MMLHKIACARSLHAHLQQNTVSRVPDLFRSHPRFVFHATVSTQSEFRSTRAATSADTEMPPSGVCDAEERRVLRRKEFDLSLAAALCGCVRPKARRTIDSPQFCLPLSLPRHQTARQACARRGSMASRLIPMPTPPRLRYLRLPPPLRGRRCGAASSNLACLLGLTASDEPRAMSSPCLPRDACAVTPAL